MHKIAGGGFCVTAVEHDTFLRGTLSLGLVYMGIRLLSGKEWKPGSWAHTFGVWSPYLLVRIQSLTVKGRASL